MYKARIDAIAKAIIDDVVSLQVIFGGTRENRVKAITKLSTINRLARSLLSGKAEPGEVVVGIPAMLSELRLALDSGDRVSDIKGLTEDNLQLLLGDLDVTMMVVRDSLFNLLRNKEGADGLEKPAA